MKRPCRFLLSAPFLTAALACSDAPAAPSTVAQADSTRSASMTTHELLLTVLDRLDAMEARFEREASVARARLDSFLLAGPGIAQAPVTSAGIEAEATACFSYEFAANGQLESSLSLWGGGDGGVGVDAYGNGAAGKLQAFAAQDVRLVPGGGAKLVLQVCGKLVGGHGAEFRAPAPTGASLATPAPPAPSATQELLRGMLRSVPLDQLATAAGRLGMSGARMGQGIDVVSSFSLADVPFGRGAAAALIGALPLPPDLANLLQHPEAVVDKAAEAASFAVDQLCNQSLFQGEFAQRASQACDLRDQMPSAAELIDLLDGLDGLPGAVSALDADLSSACSRINAMRPARVVIDPVVVNFPLGIGPVTTFPGYDKAVFPGIAAAC